MCSCFGIRSVSIQGKTKCHCNQWQLIESIQKNSTKSSSHVELFSSEQNYNVIGFSFNLAILDKEIANVADPFLH